MPGSNARKRPPRQEIARDQRLEEATASARREREIARLDAELALAQARAALAVSEALIEIGETLELRRHQTERLRGEQRDRIAVIDDAIARRSVETANLKDRGCLFVEALPDVVARLNVGTSWAIIINGCWLNEEEDGIQPELP